VTENTDWREDIQLYRTEETARRDEDRSFFEGQLAQMEDKAKAQAYAAEKEEMLRRDSLKVAKLNNEISALRDMLQISHKEDVEKQSKVDSSRFALLDNELQGLRRMLLQAMLQDSIDAQKKTQAKIEVELATREKEKASRDSLIEEKIAALEGVQTELDALQAESKDSSQLMLIAQPTISSSPTVEERYGNRIEIFGVEFKGPLVLCQILIAILMAITFLQSAIDKMMDRKGNLEYFEVHFANSPLKGITKLSLSLLTILELTGGLMLVYGIYYAFAERITLWIFYGFVWLSLTIIVLFTGQRLAKDYVGAADLVPYFMLIMLGIMSMY